MTTPNKIPEKCSNCYGLDACARECGENLQWTSDHCSNGPLERNPQIEPLLQIGLGGSQFNDGGRQPFHGCGSFLDISASLSDARWANNPLWVVAQRVDRGLKATAAERGIVMKINVIDHNINLQIVSQ